MTETHLLILLLIIAALGVWHASRAVKRAVPPAPTPPPTSSKTAIPIKLSLAEQAMLIQSFHELGCVRDTHSQHQRMGYVIGSDDTFAWRLLCMGATVEPPWTVLSAGVWYATPLLEAKLKR